MQILSGELHTRGHLDEERGLRNSTRVSYVSVVRRLREGPEFVPRVIS
jgi:hypothetical protein